MVSEAEKYKAEDEAATAHIAAKNGLESYAPKTQPTNEKLTSKEGSVNDAIVPPLTSPLLSVPLSRRHRGTCRKVGRPRTPEPSLAELDDDNHHQSKPSSHIPEDITHRLKTLSSQIEISLELSRSLQAQQVSTQNLIQLLELKVTKLQQLVQATPTKVDNQHEAHQAAIKEAIELVCVPKQE